MKSKKTLKSKTILVTAGPTREFFDPVRFLSNPSTGKMGYALAEVAVAKGASVVLISGPVFIPPPPGIRKLIRITSAEEMWRATLKESRRADIIIMTAAVSDYRPARFSPFKVKKTGEQMTIHLAPNRDILKELGQRKKKRQILVGFAAETNRLEANALKKLRKKNLDLIVANRVGSPRTGFQSDANEAILLGRNGLKKRLPLMSKEKMADKILSILPRIPSQV